METELNLSTCLVPQILMEHLVLGNGCVQFNRHRIEWLEKNLEYWHCRDLIRKEKKCRSYEQKHPNKLNPSIPPRKVKSGITFIWFLQFSSKGIVHKEFVPTGHTVNLFCLHEHLLSSLTPLFRNRCRKEDVFRKVPFDILDSYIQNVYLLFACTGNCVSHCMYCFIVSYAR